MPGGDGAGCSIGTMWSRIQLQQLGLRSRAWSRLKYSTATLLKYDRHGPADKVLYLAQEECPSMGASQIKLRTLYSPINPADINQIEGVYPIKPPVPAVAGNEGVMVVEDVGNQVNTVKPGDWVIPTNFGWGTWRSHGVCEANDVMVVPNDIPAACAAMLSVNPSTAYRMLVDFVQLEPGDSILQNGATSAVGRAVIQIAHQMGVRTINIIRDRPDFEQVKAELHNLGATHVVSEDFARTPEMKNLVATEARKPRLAFNCVGGQSSTNIVRQLAQGGIMVTYGGMAREPVTIPTSALIFRDVSLRGFWMSAWYMRHSIAERQSMMEMLVDMVRKDRLVFNYQEVPAKDYMQALKAAGSGGVKQVIVW